MPELPPEEEDEATAQGTATNATTDENNMPEQVQSALMANTNVVTNDAVEQNVSPIDAMNDLFFGNSVQQQAPSTTTQDAVVEEEKNLPT